MTLKLPKADKKKVEEALKGPTGVFFLLSIGDLEVGEQIFQGTWEQDEGGAISTNLLFSGRLPLDYYDTPCSFALVIDGVIVPQMAGLTSLPEFSEDTGATNFMAASTKATATEVTLNEDLEYSGVSPDFIIRDGVKRLPYLRGASEIAPVDEPLLYFQNEERFLPEEHVSDLFEEVEKQTNYRLRDNVFGGATFSPILEPSEDSTERIFNSTDFIKWRPPPRSERRYSEVIVFARTEDGYAFEPQRARVDYKTPPLEGAKLWIALDSVDQTASQRAKNLANKMAKKLSRGVFKDDSIILPSFDPLIEQQDTFWVYEDWKDIKGFWSRSWLCWVDTYKHDKQTLQTEVSHSAALIENDLIKGPILAMPGVSGGNKKTVYEVCDEIGGQIFLDESLSWVKNHDGEILVAEDSGNVFEDSETGEIRIICPVPTEIELWREDGNEIVFDSSLPWVTVDGNDIVFDEAASGGAVATSGNDIIVSFANNTVPYSKPLWGEDVPGEVYFDPSVSWATEDGNDIVIDEASSGGNAWVDGNDIVFS